MALLNAGYGCSLVLAILLCACGADAERPAAVPSPRAGGDVVGKRLESAWIERWIGTPLPLAGPGTAKATLVRWWTDSCPYCEASLPAIEKLRLDYADRGLATLAVYHPKPRRFESDQAIRDAAHERDYHGPLAADLDWTALDRIWLDTARRSATSASFLLDAKGVIRYVHPGPEFHPSDDPEHAQCARDHADLIRAIEALLAD